MNDSDTTIDTRGESVVVTTGELQTVFRRGDDVAAANQIASLHTQIERLRSEVDECRLLLREAVRDPERVEIDGVRCWEVVVTDEWMHAAQASGGGDGE